MERISTPIGIARSEYGMPSRRSHSNAASATERKTRNSRTHRHNCDSSCSRFPGGRGAGEGSKGLVVMGELLPSSKPFLFYTGCENQVHRRGILGRLNMATA